MVTTHQLAKALLAAEDTKIELALYNAHKGRWFACGPEEAAETGLFRINYPHRRLDDMYEFLTEGPEK
jgi:hypothetical protein